MMIRRVPFLLTAVVLAVVAASGWWYYRQQQLAQNSLLRASGLLEATEIKLSAEVGGRLLERPVRDGQPIRQGEIVAVFDSSLLDHQIQTARDTATQAHLQLQRERQTVRSPLDGWVVRTIFEVNEEVPPGAPVVVVADYRELIMKVYLPEDKFGRATLGQGASITVDAYPGENFFGEVSSIASDAEFTPRNLQTQDDRVKSVYALKLRVPNNDLRLKPGMFADAVFLSTTDSVG